MTIQQHYQPVLPFQSLEGRLPKRVPKIKNRPDWKAKVPSHELSDGRIIDGRDFACLRRFAEANKVDLSDLVPRIDLNKKGRVKRAMFCSLPVEDVKEIGGLKKLKTLELGGTDLKAIKEQCLKYLNKLVNLKRLNLAII